MIDAARIDAAARDYLARYFSTRAHLRTLLVRRVDKSIAGGAEVDRPALIAAIDRTLDGLVAEGALNDAVYARDKVRRLVRRGTSEAVVRQQLAQRGVDPGLVRAGLDAVREGGADPTRSAACAYVRRRRLGPYRRDEGTQSANRDRDLAAMGRAGFSYAVARAVLGMEREEIERLILD